jgi:hypothetical protein
LPMIARATGEEIAIRPCLMSARVADDLSTFFAAVSQLDGSRTDLVADGQGGDVDHCA